jgi:hypothetical protein
MGDIDGWRLIWSERKGSVKVPHARPFIAVQAAISTAER